MCYSEWNTASVRDYVRRAASVENVFLSEFTAETAPAVQFSSNSKLNGVMAVGLLPGPATCGGACRDCLRGCYAIRHIVGRSAGTLERCAKNTAILKIDRVGYFRQIDAAAKLCRVFRFHTEGEIIDVDYFVRAVEVARNNPGTQFLMFTKKHEIVNTYLDNGGTIPANFALLLSAWYDLNAVNNPHKLPLSAPDFSTAPAKYRRPFDASGLRVVECGGDCMKCFADRAGCFGAESGDVVRFIAH